MPGMTVYRSTQNETFHEELQSKLKQGPLPYTVSIVSEHKSSKRFQLTFPESGEVNSRTRFQGIENIVCDGTPHFHLEQNGETLACIEGLSYLRAFKVILTDGLISKVQAQIDSAFLAPKDPSIVEFEESTSTCPHFKPRIELRRV